MPKRHCDELVVSPIGVAISTDDCPLEDEHAGMCMWTTAGQNTLDYICPWFKVLTGRNITCAKEDDNEHGED